MTSTTGNDVDPNGVNHPSHYNAHPSGVECIQIVRHHNFNTGNAMKYIWRAGLKTVEGEERKSEIKDLEKAIWYLQDELERLKIEESLEGEMQELPLSENELRRNYRAIISDLRE